MKILIDLQACQTTGSRQRGIGRYSLALARALVRNGPQHEFWLLLNAAFGDTRADLVTAFEGLVPGTRVLSFHALPGCSELADPTLWRARASEALRQGVIAALRPDLVHVSSLFEGLVDDAATAIEARPDGPAVSVTLYDLIPLLNAQRYLTGDQVRQWYHRKIDSLARADLLLGISASASGEARQHLAPGARQVVNMSSAADPMFFPDPAAAAADTAAVERLGLSRPFVMYTGGIDWRKNLEGLIRAYALLPAEVRQAHQLALVCHAQPEARETLLREARSAGLSADELVLTGFVSDEDLRSLYRRCTLFVFPSLHEGFGLPALEAMMCGAVVIGSNASSIPEVIGREDALFDPASDTAMAQCMLRALTDQPWREALRAHGAGQARRFTWDDTARTALEAMQALVEARAARTSADLRAATAIAGSRKPALAMISPVPPAQSGIADYCAELLPALGQHYEITVISPQPAPLPAPSAGLHHEGVEWFRTHAQEFDRVVYQFGNSEFHAHMFDLMREHPGVLVLHDYYLGGVLNWMETHGNRPGIFHHALLASHGDAGLEHERTHGRWATLAALPCNRQVLDRATGVIVHSEFSRQCADRDYGTGMAADWRRIPHLRVLPEAIDRAHARATLGLGPDDLLVCSFGQIAATKLSERLLSVWLRSPLAGNPRCRLALVGKNAAPPYGDQIESLTARGRIEITGFADRERFRTYLAAADIAVQLRGESRGETSGAILDCLAHGLPLIANASGAIAEYPDGVLKLLPEEFDDRALTAVLMQLAEDGAERQRLGAAGRAHVARHHDPAQVAAEYQAAIEDFARHPRGAAYRALIAALAALEPVPPQAWLIELSSAVAATARALPGRGL